MCQGRLAEGEAPACAQACPNEAIKIQVVRQEAVPSDGRIIPGAFGSKYTRPSTTYVSAKLVPAAAQAADAGRLELDTAHEPLAWMLVLTQMSAGGLLGCALALWGSALTLGQGAATAGAALLCGLLGIALSILHLGQPLKAWRAFLGWRKSWLSREILAFGILPAGAAAVGLAWFCENGGLLRMAVTGTALGGVAAVWCSIMVYVDTQRPYWSLADTAGKFLGTAAVLGAGLCAVTWAWAGVSGPAMSWAMMLTVAARWTLSLWEITRYRRSLANDDALWHRSALIMQKHFGRHLEVRGFLLVCTGLALPVCIAAGAQRPWVLAGSLMLTFGSQVLERRYFFYRSGTPQNARELTTMIKLPAPTFREWHGPLTADLVREPARFGLGQVPAGLTPGRHDPGHLWLLLHRLRSKIAFERWRGCQSHARSGLSGQSWLRLPQRLGGA